MDQVLKLVLERKGGYQRMAFHGLHDSSPELRMRRKLTSDRCEDKLWTIQATSTTVEGEITYYTLIV
jgi:hypothetical protein